MSFSFAIIPIRLSSNSFRILDIAFSIYKIVPHISKIDGRDCTTSEYTVNFHKPLLSFGIFGELIRFHILFKEFRIIRKKE